MKPYAPDLSIECSQNDLLLDRTLLEDVKLLPHVAKVYGRMFYTDIPANYMQDNNMASLVSYDEPQFNWAKDSLVIGNIDNVQNGEGVLVSYGYSEKFNWNIDDTITLNISGNKHEVQIAGIVFDVPVDSANGE